MRHTNKQSEAQGFPAKLRFLNRSFLHYALICTIGLIVYSNTFSVPFQWDEVGYIQGNPIVKNLHYFSEPSSAKGLPYYDAFVRRYISYLSFAIDYKIHGFHVIGYHIVNISIHLLNALLVYFFVNLIFKTPFLNQSRIRDNSKLIALFAALLFVSHPLQTMAVTYIYQRLASLITFFYLLSLVFYSMARLSESTVSRYTSYGLSVFFAVCAMKTKENAFTLPFVITLYEFFFFSGPVRKRVLTLFPIFLTLLIIPVTVINIHNTTGNLVGAMDSATKIPNALSRGAYLLVQFKALATYLSLLFFPVGQNVIYDFPVSLSFFDIRVIFPFLLLIGILLFGIYLFLRSKGTDCNFRVVAFGIFWFFIAHSIESSIFPLELLAQEYRMYLPSVGIFMGMSTGIFLMFNKLRSREMIAFSVIAVIILFLSVTTYARNIVWQNSISLWEDVVRKSPNALKGHLNLAAAYAEKGLIDQAIEQYRATLSIKPDFYDVYVDLGLCYAEKGFIDKAIEQYNITLSIKPNDSYAHYAMGCAYYKKGVTDKAIEEFKAALRANPRFAKAHVNLGIAYAQSGALDKAIEHFKSATELEIDLAEAHYNLGIGYEKTGSLDKAGEHLKIAAGLKPDYVSAYNNFTRSVYKNDLAGQSIPQHQTDLKLNPYNAKAHLKLGNIFFKQGLLDKAIEEYHSAIKLDSASVEAHYNLGVALHDKNLPDQAIEQYKIAIRLNPGFGKAYENLGIAYARKGLMDKAIEYFQIAVKLDPGNSFFRDNLARANALKKSGNKMQNSTISKMK